MTTPKSKLNTLLTSLLRPHHALGFTTLSNFVLFLLLGDILAGFSLYYAQYLNINGVFLRKAPPTEIYWFSQKFYNIGIHIHLICVIPAGILAVVQFVPVIRHKLLILHRINGYLTLLLLLVGNVGAVMIARRSFGGTLAAQAGVGLLAIATTTSATLAYASIKRFRIDLHRAWMLRTWTYAGTIVTMRVTMLIAAPIISLVGSYYIATSCVEIASVLNTNASTYAACRENSNGYAVVHADFLDPKNAVEAVAPLELSFGMALWVSLAVHAVVVEVYLWLTRGETERLRGVSEERRAKRGWGRSKKHVPPAVEYSNETQSVGHLISDAECQTASDGDKSDDPSVISNDGRVFDKKSEQDV